MTAETATTLLTWTQGKYSTETGKAGDIVLFSISWRTTRTGKDWKMQTALPGFTGKHWEADDREELHRDAEKFLARWIGHVTTHGPSASSTTTEDKTR